MKLIFIACFASAIIAAQGFGANDKTPGFPINEELIKKVMDGGFGVTDNTPGFTIDETLIGKFMVAVLERAKLAMRPGTNGNILKVMDPFKQDNIRFDLGALKYVLYDFFKVYSNN